MPVATRSTPATTNFELWGGRAVLGVADGERLTVALAAVRSTVEEFDRSCSSFRSDSELAALNGAHGAPTVVSQTLFDAIEASIRAAQLTDGDVDPTVGLALVAHRLLPGGEALGPLGFVPVPGFRAVELDGAARTVRVARGVRIDLGATAKALAADRASAAAATAAGCGVLVGLLGDLAIAGEPPSGGWAVRVTDDHRSGVDAPGQTVALREGGLATSSTTVRRTPSGDGHHLIDPRTSQPVRSPYRTVSVVAGCCLDANIAATATIVRGTSAAAWLSERKLPARLVSATGEVTYVAGWPPDGDDLQ